MQKAGESCLQPALAGAPLEILGTSVKRGVPLQRFTKFRDLEKHVSSVYNKQKDNRRKD